MTKLSVNLNKIALLRNSRGRDFPKVLNFAQKFINLGVDGITVHPREDERHIKRSDVYELSDFLKTEKVEFNVEGYPSETFLKLIEATQPDQCTLVPDLPGQLTSDHGWDPFAQFELLSETIARLHAANVRVSVFLDPKVKFVYKVKETEADRIELYTESFAASFGKENNDSILEAYRQTALIAQEVGLGVNAGHDLDSKNLGKFLTIPNILEVSIGHVLLVECIEEGIETIAKRYLSICQS